MRKFAVFLLISLIGALAAYAAINTVVLDGPSRSVDCGVLVYRKGVLAMKPSRHSPTIPLSTLINADSVIGFSSDRQMGRLKVIGSTGTTVHVTMPARVHVPVSFWIISDGDYGGRVVDVENSIGDWISAANTLYASERTGIVIELGPVHNVTASPGAALYGDDYPSGPPTLPASSTPAIIESTFGADRGVINVYVFNTVWANFGSAMSGIWGGGNAGGLGTGFVAISWAASNDLLAHELGHNFYLPDCGVVPTASGSFRPACIGNFNDENVMTHFSSNRKYVTEGQTYWVEYNTLSTINALYHGRTGTGSTSNPPSIPWANFVPPLDLRIWADGTLGP